MRLRNFKETVEPTIIDTLEDVHPTTLDEPFHWYVKVRSRFFFHAMYTPFHSIPQVGSPVWVKTSNGKWRHGQVVHEEGYRYLPHIDAPLSMDCKFGVRHSRNKHTETFVPMDGVMKPDTPQVRELLRQAGYFV
jgi:hypothetical protein